MGAALEHAEPLQVEASHRHFYRLVTNQTNTTFVCMQSPPALENNAQFTALAGLFGKHALPVPQILACDTARGYFLLDDLGTDQFADLYGTTLEHAALAAAIDALHLLQSIGDPAIPVYDTGRFATELDLFNEWFVHQLLGLDADREAYQDAYHTLIEQTQHQPQVCVHRDYHCRNLLFNHGQLGIVDFQDALLGPAMYDIASLLRDCYHVFAEADIDRWLEIYVVGSPLSLTITDAKRWMDLTAIQRQLKAIGIFARLHLRDDKSSHLVHIQPLLARIAELAGHYPETRPLRLLLESLIPPTAVKLAPLIAATPP